MNLSGNWKYSVGTIFILIENLLDNFNDKCNNLKVKLNNSVIFYSKHDQSIHLEEIKCISPPILKRVSEIEEIKFDDVLRTKYEQSAVFKFLYKCQGLQYLDLSSNRIYDHDYLRSCQFVKFFNFLRLKIFYWIF